MKKIFIKVGNILRINYCIEQLLEKRIKLLEKEHGVVEKVEDATADDLAELDKMWEKKESTAKRAMFQFFKR